MERGESGGGGESGPKGDRCLGQQVRGGQLTLGWGVRATTGPRVSCPGGQFKEGTSHPTTAYVKLLYVIHSFNWKSAMVVFKMRDSVPSTRYSSVCNVLRLWNISLIPTYRVSLPTL